MLFAIPVVLLLAGGSIYYVKSQNKPPDSNIEATTPEEKTNDEDTTPETPPDTSTNTTTPNSPSTKPSVPFQISKVYFSQAPKPPSDAGFGQCTVGQEFTYVAYVDVTATAAGTMVYRWKVSDHLSGATTAYDEETYQFKSAGKTTMSKTLSYTARETPGYEGNLWNRQYINVFVSSPNETYANIDNKATADSGKGFIWGTYVDLC